MLEQLHAMDCRMDGKGMRGRRAKDCPRAPVKGHAAR